MARPPSREQEAIQHALATGADDVVAAFLAANPKKMRQFTGLNAPQFQRLLDYLQSGNPDAAERARSRLDYSLEHITKIPTDRLKLTKGVKEHVVRAQRNDEFFALVNSVSKFLRQPLKSLIKIPAELYAFTAAAMGMEKRERVGLLAGISVPLFAATALNTMIATTQPADAALTPEPSAHSDTLSGTMAAATRRTHPIPEITITPRRYNNTEEALADLEPEERESARSRRAPPEITVSARRAAPPEITVSRGNGVSEIFDNVLTRPVNNSRLTPELAQLMRRSDRARELVTMIRNEAAKHGLDADLGSNQLFKETSFIEKYITGEALSPAGAIGFAQIMPRTGAAHGFTTRDLRNPEIAVRAWGTIMSQLTKQFGGDQRLATIAYNGGGGAIRFVREQLGTQSVTFDQWVDFMVDRRAEKGTSVPSAWHVETLEYAMTISPDHRGRLAQIKEREAQQSRLATTRTRPSAPERAPNG